MFGATSGDARVIIARHVRDVFVGWHSRSTWSPAGSGLSWSGCRRRGSGRRTGRASRRETISDEEIESPPDHFVTSTPPPDQASRPRFVRLGAMIGATSASSEPCEGDAR
jgi:hypothetical protein